MSCHREICWACSRVSAVGFWVPDSVWRESVPDRFLHTVLCLGCFISFAEDVGVKWDSTIEFHPVSLATHLELVKEGD